MSRRMLFVALVGVGAVIGLASKSLAQSAPKLPKPDQDKKGMPNPWSKRLGLQITMVLRVSPAAMANLDVGDIIVTANGSPVSSLAELNLLLAQSGRVAYLQVLDGTNGWLTDVVVYPVRGKIGVLARPVPLSGYQPFPPRPFPPLIGKGSQAGN